MLDRYGVGFSRLGVFLSGFSEGGWASLAALRLLEEEGQPVLGSAQVAGAYDRRRALPAALKGGARSSSLYLAYAAWGQSAYYGQRLDSVMPPQYAKLVEQPVRGRRANGHCQGPAGRSAWHVQP